MGAAQDLLIRIRGDSKSAEAALGKTGKAASSAGKLVSGLAAMGAGAAILGFLQEGAEKARAAQVDITRLATAVRNSGGDWKAMEGAVDANLKALSRVSAFGRGEMRGVLADLVSATNDMAEAQDLLALSTDVARGRKIELAEASKIVIKANMGNIGALRKLGIEIDKGATREEAIAKLRAVYANQAADYALTEEGKLERLNNAYGAMQASIGRMLLPMTEKLTDASLSLFDALDKAPVLRDTAAGATLLAGGVVSVGEAYTNLSPLLADLTGTSNVAGTMMATLSRGAKSSAGEIAKLGPGAIASEAALVGLAGAAGMLAGTLAVELIPGFKEWLTTAGEGLGMMDEVGERAAANAQLVHPLSDAEWEAVDGMRAMRTAASEAAQKILDLANANVTLTGTSEAVRGVKIAYLEAKIAAREAHAAIKDHKRGSDDYKLAVLKAKEADDKAREAKTKYKDAMKIAGQEAKKSGDKAKDAGKAAEKGAKVGAAAASNSLGPIHAIGVQWDYAARAVGRYQSKVAQGVTPAPSGPGHATGAVFYGPTRPLVGEDGPEVLIPLSQRYRANALPLLQMAMDTIRPSGTSGGTSITLNITGSRADADAIAASVRRELTGLLVSSPAMG